VSDALGVLEFLQRHEAFALVADVHRRVIVGHGDDGAVDDFAFLDLLLLHGGFEELGEGLFIARQLRGGIFRAAEG
jgi:hypothetical protein